MTNQEAVKPRYCGCGVWRSLLNGASVLLSVSCGLSLTPVSGAEPSVEEILTRIADNSQKSQAATYLVVRDYQLYNFRFAKQATVSVQVAYRSDVGPTYTVLKRTGSARLVEIIERLVASEADASKPAKLADHEISPVNYRAFLRGTETTTRRDCYVIDLVPKHKSKYLIKGMAWVDRKSYNVFRLEGSTSASVSMWVGTPHIELEFDEIGGVWLPTYAGAISSSFLLGTSELKIRYSNYLISGGNNSTRRAVVESAQGTGQ